MTKMIKRYSQFIKENKQVNEDFDQEEIENANIEEREEDFEPEGAEVEDNEVFSQAEEEISSDGTEEEGEGYIGQKMIQELADALDVQVDADGSINYNGQKINFYSETEMFHIGSQKFETVEEVVNYLNGETGEHSEDDIRQNELEREDDDALLSGNEDEPSFEETEGDLAKRDLESEFESKSYKYTRKFESFRK